MTCPCASASCAIPRWSAGVPTHPRELVDHRVIAYSYFTAGNDWSFSGPEGEVSVRTRPWMMASNGETCVATALAGQGIVLQPGFLVNEALEAGTLVELMPDYPSTELGVYAVYPTRKFVTPKVRALVDFLVSSFPDSL